ncbi:putative E3 ubiquitin-protein ligase-like isoform X3 [Capsicum annuum]|nr:putative E3 ubiquitin-protein ligase-like isoform X3 [Capsicum annuum]
MKFFLNRLRHRRQNPNPNHTASSAMLSDLAPAAGASSSSSSSAVINSDEEEEMEYESLEDEDEEDKVSEEEEQEGNWEQVAEDEEERRELDEASSKSLVVVETENAFLRTEKPPTDDICPICFGNFVVPCRGPCGHWYCGGCILQYWNYGAALQPCSCPMCSKKLTDLKPEASLYSQQDAEVIEVLKKVRKYNRLFVGGTYGLMLKVLGLPFYMKRVFNEMMNPDRPGAHLNKLRIFAMFLGLLYTLSPFDFLRIGRQNVIDVFDYSAIALSSVLYFVGLYLRRRRFRHVREMAEADFAAH